MTSEARIRISADDKASAEIKSVRGSLANLAKDAKGSILTGVGLGAGVTAFNAIGGAVSAATDYIGDAIRAAREETTSVALLTASLKVNSAAFDGNTDAIEKTIEERMALGFADDDQRTSLGQLTAVTKDHNKALDLQRTAMDLARLRGIDLSTAGDIIGKVYGGNIGILARYGIQLDKGTSSTEALAAIQSMTAGQAEAWARTEEGAAQTAGMAFEELSEDIGQLLLPVMTELATFARDVVVPALRSIVDYLKVAGKNIAEWSDGVSDYITTAQIRFGDLGQTVEDRANAIGRDVVEMKELVRVAMTELSMDLGTAMTYAEQRLAGLPPAMTTAGQATYQAWRQQEAGIVDAIRDPFVDGTAAAVDEVTALPGELADAIRSGRQAWRTELATLTTDINNEVSHATRATELGAALFGPTMARGMASGDPLVKAQARHTQSLILAELSALPGNAWQYGVNTGYSVAAGIDAAGWRIHQAASNAAWQIRNVIGIASEPRDPSSPLHGVTEWGGNIVKTIAAGMRGEIGAAVGASGALAAALVPRVAMPGLASASGGYAGGSGAGGVIEVHSHVHLEGRQIAEVVNRWNHFTQRHGARLLPA